MRASKVSLSAVVRAQRGRRPRRRPRMLRARCGEVVVRADSFWWHFTQYDRAHHDTVWLHLQSDEVMELHYTRRTTFTRTWPGPRQAAERIWETSCLRHPPALYCMWESGAEEGRRRMAGHWRRSVTHDCGRALYTLSTIGHHTTTVPCPADSSGRTPTEEGLRALAGGGERTLPPPCISSSFCDKQCARARTRSHPGSAGRRASPRKTF